MYCLPVVYSILVFLGRLVYSIPQSSDDFDLNELLFDDSVQPFLEAEDGNNFLSVTTTTSDVALGNPCVVTNDQNFDQAEDATNLFSRADGGPQCLPPVNIGAETLHLFEAPFDTLNNVILPLDENTQTPDPPPPDALPPLRYPGLLPEGEKGDYDPETVRKQGYQRYTGPIHYEKEKDSCEELTAQYGSYPNEVCCDALYVGYGAQSPSSRSVLQGVDAQTIANQDIAVIYNCIFAVRNWACPVPYVRYRLCCNIYDYILRIAYSCIDTSAQFREQLLL